MTDREKLIELLSADPCGGSDCCTCERIVHVDCYREQQADFLLANGVTFATDTNAGSKWIRVEERLPEDLENVLTCDHKRNIHIMRHHHDFKDPFGIAKNNMSYYPVTHWMPLPEPPKED